ncbi:MAG: NifB/NifX family molybdenum-iron cluster-binding protein, partial [Euryarchaeota archaeon]|nr:NifB/NifX family molybdenum-iron cluster-binding protein [Euryarchaeota archaeon]
MKICVTSTGPTIDAPVDPRFGRCQYFVIVDSETMAYEAMPNPSIGAPSGAGIQAAQSVANTGAQVVITGTVGPNATATLGAAGIRMVTGASGTVRDAVEQYKSGRLQAAPGAPAPGIPATGMPGAGMGKGMGRGGGRGMG